MKTAWDDVRKCTVDIYDNKPIVEIDGVTYKHLFNVLASEVENLKQEFDALYLIHDPIPISHSFPTLPDHKGVYIHVGDPL